MEIQIDFQFDSFPEQKEMTKKDFVICLGDFGLVWNYRGESKTERFWLDWLNHKAFTTLFIDGNHDNLTGLILTLLKNGMEAKCILSGHL